MTQQNMIDSRSVARAAAWPAGRGVVVVAVVVVVVMLGIMSRISAYRYADRSQKEPRDNMLAIHLYSRGSCRSYNKEVMIE